MTQNVDTFYTYHGRVYTKRIDLLLRRGSLDAFAFVMFSSNDLTIPTQDYIYPKV